MKLLLRKNRNLNTISHIQCMKVEEKIITEELIQENEKEIIIIGKTIIPKDNKRAMKEIDKKTEKGLSILGEELRRMYKYKQK